MKFRINLSVGLVLAILIVTFGNVSCSSKNHTREKRWTPPNVDVREPLILTEGLLQFQNTGKLHVLRQRARVTHTDLHGIESYAGYLNMGRDHSYNYFWYFPAKESPENAPVVLYLEGSPDKNMFFSIFMQNGPFSMSPEGEVRVRNESWNNKHHMIYMDVMPGFGYTFKRGEIMQIGDGQEVADLMAKFFDIFPSIKGNPFFLAGSYYAWTYLPLFYSYVNWINLKGIIIANGLVNQGDQFAFGDHLYTIGLIDDNEKPQFEEQERRLRIEEFRDFPDYLERVMMSDDSLLKRSTGYSNPYSIFEDDIHDDIVKSIRRLEGWIKSHDVRRALHIGDRQNYHSLSETDLRDWKTTVSENRFDYLQGIFKNYRVLIYTGNFDMLCPYPFVESWIRQLNWPNKQAFTDAERLPWKDSSNEMAGYIKKSDNITEIVLINAGHFPCIDQPERTLELVERFTHNTL